MTNPEDKQQSVNRMSPVELHEAPSFLALLENCGMSTTDADEWRRLVVVRKAFLRQTME